MQQEDNETSVCEDPCEDCKSFLQVLTTCRLPKPDEAERVRPQKAGSSAERNEQGKAPFSKSFIDGRKSSPASKGRPEPSLSPGAEKLRSDVPLLSDRDQPLPRDDHRYCQPCVSFL